MDPTLTIVMVVFTWVLAVLLLIWLLRTSVGTHVLELVSRTTVPPVSDGRHRTPNEDLKHSVDRSKRIWWSWLFVAFGPIGLAAFVVILMCSIVWLFAASLIADQRNSIK